MTWILLVLLAQFTWALGNYLDHYLLVRYRPQVESESSVGTLVMVSAAFTVVTGTLIGLSSLILFRLGVAESNPLDIAPIERLTAMSVGVLEILWLIPYMHALDESDETLAPPLFQTVPVFGLVLGFLFFDEAPPALHILAGACILAGSIALNTNWWEPRTDSRAVVNVRVIALMMLASFSHRSSGVRVQGYRVGGKLLGHSILDEHRWDANGMWDVALDTVLQAGLQ